MQMFPAVTTTLCPAQRGMSLRTLLQVVMVQVAQGLCWVFEMQMPFSFSAGIRANISTGFSEVALSLSQELKAGYIHVSLCFILASKFLWPIKTAYLINTIPHFKA